MTSVGNECVKKVKHSAFSRIGGARAYSDPISAVRVGHRWKDLERTAARVLGGVRVPRWLDFGVSAPDVLVEDFGLVVDTKAHKRFAHHSLMDNISAKYCEPGEVPCLVTKADRQRGEYATVPLDFLAELLAEVRGVRAEIKRRCLRALERTPDVCSDSDTEAAACDGKCDAAV